MTGAQVDDVTGVQVQTDAVQEQVDDRIYQTKGQAEQNHEQAEPCLNSTQVVPGATQSRGQAEQDGSPGSSNTQNIRQSHTIQWAVARYVSSPTQNYHVQILIRNNLGTTPIECQADLECSDARAKDDQAEECQEENGLNVDEETSDHAAECPVGYTVVDGQ